MSAIARAVEAERASARAQPLSEREEAQQGVGQELALQLVDHLIQIDNAAATFRVGYYEVVVRPAK